MVSPKSHSLEFPLRQRRGRPFVAQQTETHLSRHEVDPWVRGRVRAEGKSGLSGESFQGQPSFFFAFVCILDDTVYNYYTFTEKLPKFFPPIYSQWKNTVRNNSSIRQQFIYFFWRVVFPYLPSLLTNKAHLRKVFSLSKCWLITWQSHILNMTDHYLSYFLFYKELQSAQTRFEVHFWHQCEQKPGGSESGVQIQAKPKPSTGLNPVSSSDFAKECHSAPVTAALTHELPC